MTESGSITVHFASRLGRLRAAILRGHAGAVAELLAVDSPRAATMLAWVSMAARPGSALAERIEAAAAVDGPTLMVRCRADDEALFAFSRGIAVAHPSQFNADARQRLLAEWRAEDPGSLVDFAAVCLGFDLSSALTEIMDVLDATGDGPRGLGDLILRIAPRMSRRVTLTIARHRPDLVARATGVMLAEAQAAADTQPDQAADSSRPCLDQDRIVTLLGALATVGSVVPIDEQGRGAVPVLASIARGRRSGIEVTQRAAALLALHRVGWRASVRVAGEALSAGFVATDHASGSPAPAGRIENLLENEYGRHPDADPRSILERLHCERRSAIDAAAGLVSVLVGIGTPESMALVAAAGRRHRDAAVRKAALKSLIRVAGIARRSVGPGQAIALAREQLHDVSQIVACHAVGFLRDVMPGPRFARVLLSALHGMPDGTVDDVVISLATGLPAAEHHVAIRRICETGNERAMLRFLAAVDEPRSPDGSSQSDRTAERSAARADTWSRAISESIDEGQLRSALLMGNFSSPGEVSVGPRGCALLREAARHWTRGSAGHRLLHQAERFRQRADRFDDPRDNRAENVGERACAIVSSVLRLLRGDAGAASLRAELIGRALEQQAIQPHHAMVELARLPDTSVVRSLWRRTIRGLASIGLFELLFRDSSLDASCSKVAPWIYQEVVALSLDREACPPLDITDFLPSRTTDHAFNAKFIRPGETAATEASVAEIMLGLTHEAFKWIETVGQRLLRRRIAVQATLTSVGHTSPPDSGAKPKVFVSPDPILADGMAGAAVVRAVGLHEIGHHLYDFADPRFYREFHRMQRMGLRSLFNVMSDERLERSLRSLDSAWGQLLDQAISYYFTREVEPVSLSALAAVSGRDVSELRGTIAAGDLPGTLCHLESAEAEPPDAVRLRPAELMAVPGLATPEDVFMWALRTGADRRSVACPRARAALRLVPNDLRSMSPPAVGGLCIRIAEALGGAVAERARRKERRELAEQNAQVAALLGELEKTVRSGRPDRRDVPREGVRPEEGLDGFGEAAASEATTETVAPPRSGLPSFADRIARIRRLREEREAWDGNDDGSEVIPPLPKRVTLSRDDADYRELVGSVHRHVRTVRRTLDQLGTIEVDDPAARRGHRLDVGQARTAGIVMRPNMLVGRRTVEAADCHLGILIDRSGSMAGTKLETARRFGALVAEAARGRRGIDGWVAAFDDDTWFDLGDFERTSIASLRAGGGNNDAGALAHAATLMRGSRRKHRVLVLVSDGEPTECSVKAFHVMAARLENDHGIAVIHVVIDQMDRRAVLPRCVDLANESSMEESVRRFAGLLVDVVRRGGRAVVASRPRRPEGDGPTDALDFIAPESITAREAR